jgi:hypothetical protein
MQAFIRPEVVEDKYQKSRSLAGKYSDEGRNGKPESSAFDASKSTQVAQRNLFESDGSDWETLR